MKPVQILIDEALLAELDADDEVRREGRSAVLRQAVREYLKRRRRQAIARQYREAYADGQGLGDEFEGWEKQGEWPPE
jgi:metal-responsive CopG/Arc/MetJ family transcriptional regulator